MATQEVNESLAFLQKTKSKEGSSVFDHLTSMLMKVLEERPTNAVELLETSMLMSKTRNDPNLTEPLLPIPQDPASKAKIENGKALFRNPEPKINPESGEPMELDAPNEFEAEDVVEQAALLEAVGAGLSRKEMYGVAMTVKKLGEDAALKMNTVRFFGKLLGTHGDYYVFECSLKEPAEVPAEEGLGPEDAPMEEAGKGVNTYSYYVCSYLGGAFSALPDVTCKQIKVARQIKKFLTGNLAAPVSAYPPFPGNEANYLRAQIARIACASVLCPTGMFSANDEEMSVEKAEDFAPQDAAAMMDLPNWSHRYPHLKKQGRCVVFKREAPEGEDEEREPTEEEKEADEAPGLLNTIDQDAEIAAAAAWSPVSSSAVTGAKFVVSGVRSNMWPGAYAISKGAQFVNVYVGYGIKNAPFVPLPPPAVAKEFDMGQMESTDLPPKPKPAEVEGEGEAEEE